VLRQLRSPIIYILLFALAFDAVVWFMEEAGGWPFESIAIVIILVFNTVMGVWQEYRAEDALAHLKKLSAPNAWVRRNGEMQRVPASELVPGDLVRIEAGNRVFADGTLIGDAGLMVDESMLTGESLSVERGRGQDLFAGDQDRPVICNGSDCRHAEWCCCRADTVGTAAYAIWSRDRPLGGCHRGRIGGCWCWH